MTQFPTLIDQVAAAVLAPAQVTENPHHRAILDVFVEIQDLDRQLAELAGAELPGVSPAEQLNTLTDLLVERMAAGADLSALLATSCCCAAAYEAGPSAEYEPLDDEEPGFDPDFDDFEGFDDFEEPGDLDDFDDLHEDACEEFLSCPSGPQTIVHACLAVFDDEGAPEYVSAAELVERLRDLPGQAEGRWSYADLTPLRLGLLLRGYGVQPCNPRAADGSRYRAYRRADLLAARPNCSC
ncbi:hypothetical protein BN159_7677 [Streptomyces davaonensis JCM 4913]|uniref:DUF3631 domain-containing protein n=1 Tax=Streptomyces davaonensis (strain DSM 101723 / JCM 4913 / KCC S-0913 / 768) TaxID=1214101 RepID=K4R702_STRDJ|nr:DUF3631 domain-containing protein [Streptomyces davaonensis]CCK32056.1 hypothetical protein BN159_7677 [Streptomyces davaonensis JCM 4913]